MSTSKFHFEQIAVETVKKIATERPTSNKPGQTETPGNGPQTTHTSPETESRELAQRIKLEKDRVTFDELLIRLNDVLARNPELGSR